MVVYSKRDPCLTRSTSTEIYTLKVISFLGACIFFLIFGFLLLVISPIYLLLLCPRGYPTWPTKFETSYQTSLSTLTWPFRDDFSIPTFSVFLFLPRATFFFSPHQRCSSQQLMLYCKCERCGVQVFGMQILVLKAGNGS